MDKLTMTFKFGIRAGLIDAHDCKAIKRALCMTGKRKGLIKKTAPSRYEDPEAYAAWMAIMGELNACRLSVWGLMGLPVNGRAILERVQRWAFYFRHFINKDLQRPYEFNLYHHHLEATE